MTLVMTLETELGVFFTKSMESMKLLRSWCAYIYRSQHCLALLSSEILLGMFFSKMLQQ